MGWTDLWLRLRALASRGRAERDLDEELNFHLEMEARKARQSGLAETDAERRARVNFGGVDQARESCRDVRGLGFLQSLGRDLRYGLRVLLRSPAFTAAAVLSLAVGIGATTAIFSLVDAVLLRTLPVRDPQQLVAAKWKGDYSNLMMTGATNDGAGLDVFSWQAFSDILTPEFIGRLSWDEVTAPRLNWREFFKIRERVVGKTNIENQASNLHARRLSTGPPCSGITRLRSSTH